MSISKKEKVHDFGELRESLSDADKRGLDESAPAFHISDLRAVASALKWPKSAPFVTIRRPRHCLSTMHIEPMSRCPRRRR